MKDDRQCKPSLLKPESADRIVSSTLVSADA